MVQRVSHSSVFVTDQDSAYDFYVNKMGFEVRMDAKMDNGFRWLTVSPKGQPDHEIILSAIKPNPMMTAFDQATADAVHALVSNGKLIMGALSTDDCRETHKQLAAKGVVFLQEPTDEFYGIEALLRDDSGNIWSLTQGK